ncbi:hypothetical protein VTI74DRAFT_11337 [Chaetomium olivicolor]
MSTLTVSWLQALTQGTSQSFLDAFVNVANSPDVIKLEGEDTWLSRLKAARASKDAVEKDLVYYGVEVWLDLWLDLYPDVFHHYEGFFGFCMPDILTLDADIAMRLPDELHRDDWAALLLHYEGLESLAHPGGIKSYVADVFNMGHFSSPQFHCWLIPELHLQDNLLLLMGVYGMTQHGDRGGDTLGELDAAMALLSPRLQSLGRGQQSTYEAPK